MIIIFPTNPIDGQTFRDPFGIIWIYDLQSKSWTSLSKPIDLPLAKSGKKCVVNA